MKRSADIAVLAVVLVIFLVLNLLLFGRAARVARRTEIVPVPSTYRTTPSGCQGIYEVLGRLGVRTGRLTTPVTHGLPEDVTTLVVLEPGIRIGRMEAYALRLWVDRGNTLVLASEGIRSRTSPLQTLSEVLFLRDPADGAWRLEAAGRAADPYGAGRVYRWEVDRGGRYTAGVRALELDREASQVPGPEALRTAAAGLIDERRAWPVAGHAPAWLCTVTAIGRGRVFYVPTAALFANGQLARADNAVFVTNLLTAHLRGGRLLFDEFHLGNASSESLLALLWRPGLRPITIQVALALVLILFRMATRFGPARVDQEEPPRRPAVEYVTALAALYQRAGAHDEAARLWYADLRRRLLKYAGLTAAADDARLVQRLAGQGVEAQRLASLLARLRNADALTPRELLALAREADDLVRGLGERESAWRR